MKVLVVVADPAVRQQLEGFFRARKHTVTVCLDSAATLESLDEDSFQYVLIDLGLSDGGGLDLCRFLRSKPASERCFVLVLLDEETPDALRTALEAGADDFLPRSFSLKALQLRLAVAERVLADRRHRHSAEQRASDSERRYRTLIETMHEAVFQVDDQGVIEFANSRLSELTGYTLDELIGESADHLLVEPSIRDRLPGQTLLGAGVGSEEYSIPLKVKSGEQLWVNLTGAPVTTLDGRVGGSLGVFENITEQRLAEEALRHREEYFRVLWENASDLITMLDIDGRILYQSTSIERLLGSSPDTLVGGDFLDLLHEEDRDEFAATFNRALETPGATEVVEYRVRRGDEEWRSLEGLCNNLIDNPVVGAVVVTARDVTERRRLEAELKRERSFFQQLFRNSPAGIVILDNNDHVVDCNRSFVDLFQFELHEIKGQSLIEFIVPEQLCDEADELSQTVLRRQTVVRETLRRRKDGTFVDVSILGYPIEMADHQIGAYGLYSDISERKHAERKLYHEAFHDALTGLPNRTLLTERLERALRRAKRRQDYNFALLFIDLDRFKVINDSLGHAAGDELLIEMARRLESCLRPGDTTARLGGDEFTILLEDLKEVSDATRVAERALRALSEPFRIAGQDVVSSGSIGIAFSSSGYENADDLLRDADIAMYRAKSRGKACYEVFDTEMHKSAVERLRLETELRRAVDQQQMVLHYQPIVSLNTRRIVGFEALVRWQHPTRGLLGPDQLIPVCEETGIIVPLGRWVFRETCRQVAAWQKEFPASDSVMISVNFSVKEICSIEFLKELDRTVEQTGVNPTSIGIEITESLMMEAAETIADVLWQLRRRGFRLYIDDFGTGYSSLSSLHRFPIDTLKIDRSFIQSMEPGGENLEIVRAIAALGESLGLNVVAEGVETRDQEEQLRRLDLTFVQGYLYSKPLPQQEAARLIAANASF